MIRAAQESQVPSKTPVPDVGYSFVRKVKTRLDSDAKVIAAVRRALDLHTNHVIDDETLAATLNVIIDEDVRPFDEVCLTFQMTGHSFSTLTQKDMPLLYTYYAGTIEFNSALFSVTPNDYFLPQLDDYTLTFSRDKQAGARLLIGHYLCHATNLAKDIFQSPRLLVNSEVDVEPVYVNEDLGWLHGTLDFAVVEAAGMGSTGNLSLLLTNANHLQKGKCEVKREEHSL